MARSARDENRVPGLLATTMESPNDDPVIIWADPVTHRLLATTTISGTVAATQSGAWTVQPGNTANTTAWKVDGSAVTQPVSGTITATSAGDVAHDAADSGNPVKIGGEAHTASPVAVAASDRVDGQFDIYGKQIVREALREDLGWQQTQISSSTSETTIVTADATYKLDIYLLSVTNTSATGTKVTLKDSTAGTTRWVGWVPAYEIRGFAVSPSGAVKQNAANNNWTLTCTTSVAAIEVTVAWARSL